MKMIDSPGVNEFLELGDVPHSYSGQASKSLIVNGGANGLTFGAGGTTQYAEPVINASNNDVVYQTGNNPVPDFIFDNNNDFVMRLVTI